MANTYSTPNMNLVIPTVLVDPGPDWASNINASLTILDGHTHNPGSGVQITPSGININADLAFNQNNLLTARSLRLYPNASSLSGAADLGCLYEAGVDLYYNDGNGTPVRITSGGSLVGTAGSISGLPNGTASASYSGGTFTFQSATLTSANIDAGSYIFRNNSASSFGLTLQPPVLGANYAVTLPALPSQTNVLTIGTTGILASITYDAVGQGMTFVGANAIALSMSTTGSNDVIAGVTSVSTTVANIIGNAMTTSGANSIAGSMVNANMSLGGPSLQADSRSLVVVNTNNSYNLAVIRAIVSSSGTVTTGEGISSTSHPSTGVYTLTYTTGFTDTPSVFFTSVNTGGVFVITTQSTTGCALEFFNLSGNPTNTAFNFFAIGERLP